MCHTFAKKKKHGEYGLMKLAAKKRHPRYIICRRQIRRYIRSNLKRDPV